MRCYGCMREYGDEYEICPYCGYVRGEKAEEAIHIEPGTMLSGRYLIGRAVGSGGFGVTYIAWDTKDEHKVAIKEYLPSEFATRIPGQTQVSVFSGDKTQQFSDGLDKFMDEARRLAKFKKEKGIVNIYDSFEENGTAYIIMEYLEGETLASYLEHEGTLPAERAIGMMMPIIESLATVHEAGIIHRDIAPDNIFVTNTGDVKLIDFGAARFATTSHSRSLSVIVKAGYSPEEQYRSRGDQGPHTDVYALGGVLYKMITGITPPDAMERKAQFEGKNKDILEPLSKYTKEITANQETAIMNAMNVRVEDRTPDVVSFAGELLSEEVVTRRAGKIKKNFIYSWPLWLKIAAPTAFAVVCTLIVLLLTGVIHFRAPKKEIDLDGMVRVPSIVNYTFDDAEAMLKKQGGLLNLVIGGGEYSNEIDENKIFMQTPDAASKVAPGTEVQATISYGAESKFMIDVIGYSKELAQQELESLGFTVEFKEEMSEDAPGTVIAQSIAPEQKAALGETVILTVSTGTDDMVDTSVEVTVPSVVGMSVEEAKETLKKAKLYLSVDSTIKDPSQKTGIVQQAPGAKMKTYQGDTVSVVVNKPDKCYMPPVIGKTLEQAIDAIEDAGLTYGTVSYEENDSYGENCVIRANYKADTELKSGTKINLVVNKTSQVSVPNVCNMTQSKAVSKITEANLVANVVKEASDKPKDTVLRQTPSANTKVAKQSTVTIYVSTGSSSAEVTSKKATLSSLTILSNPKQTEYYMGDSFKNAGMTAKATYSDGSTKTIPASQLKVEGFSSSSPGNKTVYASYTENGETQKASFVIKIIKPEIKLSASKIPVAVGGNGQVTATTYPSGQKVTWSISPESVATVNKSNGTVTGVKEGEATLIASFTYNSQSYSTTCKVIVNKNSVSVTKVNIIPSTCELEVGGKKQLSAQVIPSDATFDKITWSVDEKGKAYVRVNSNTGEIKAIKAGGTAKVYATAGGKTGSCTVTVKAAELSSISIAKNPNKMEYRVGESFDSNGMVVKATYSDGSNREITGYTCSPTILNNAGSQKITVSYTEGSVTRTTYLTVTVNAVTLSSISITTNPSKTTYNVGDSFSKAGMVVTAKYSNGSSKTVTGYTCSPTTLNSAGSQKITISYSENDVTRNTYLFVEVNSTAQTRTVTLQTDSGIASVSGGGNYLPGDKVTVRASGRKGYGLKNWTASVSTLKMTKVDENVYSFTMPDYDVSLTANSIPQLTMSVASSPDERPSVMDGFNYTIKNGEKLEVQLKVKLPTSYVQGSHKYTLWGALLNNWNWIETGSYYLDGGTINTTYSIDTSRLGVSNGTYSYAFSVFYSEKFSSGNSLCDIRGTINIV